MHNLFATTIKTKQSVKYIFKELELFKTTINFFHASGEVHLSKLVTKITPDAKCYNNLVNEVQVYQITSSKVANKCPANLAQIEFHIQAWPFQAKSLSCTSIYPG